MTDDQKKLQSELELNASNVLKNCSEAFLNQKKEKYYTVIGIALPVAISLIGVVIAILKT